MAMYITQGELGAGKGIYAAFIASLYYNNPDPNIRVATNYPLDTFRLGKSSLKPITVLPTNVRPCDLEFLGEGSPHDYKDNFGCLIIDECLNFLNTRNFRNSDREKLMNWFTHARKHHWDVYFIVQHPSFLDSQVREGLTENLVELKDLSKIRVPFASTCMEIFSTKQPRQNKRRRSVFPHIVRANVFYKEHRRGEKPSQSYAITAKDYYNVYDTDFIFRDGVEFLNNKAVDMRAPYTLLPGAYLSEPVTDWSRWEEGRILPFKPVSQQENNMMNPSQPQSLPQPQPPQQPPSQQVTPSQQSSRKKRFGFKSIMKYLLLGLMGYISWLFVSSRFFSHEEAPVNTSPQTQTQTAAAPASPPVPVISSRWRLTGWLQLSDNEGYFILRDNSGNIRYFRSDEPYKGLFTELKINNEIVTFYSGTAITSPVSSSPELPGMVNGAVNGAVSGAVSSVLN
ncbi:TPA: hypothetical protein P5S08_003735 [Salmonella enterica subsp. enterica serovar Concord]|nr:hypothetical protein [Salmonella enterica subsp. enterica serovar Concord]